MKRILFIFAIVLLSASGFAQVQDRGAYKEPVPETGDADLRWLDAELFRSGFIFNDRVRTAFFEHCMRKVAPELKFSEATWEWLEQNPEVLNATFALEYPPNPNVIHNFVKLAKLVGPTYATKYKQLLIAFAVKYRDRRLLVGGTPESGDHQYSEDGSVMAGGRNFTWKIERKAELEKLVARKQGWSVNSDVKPITHAELAKNSAGEPFADERDRMNRTNSLHAQFNLSGNKDAEATAHWLKQNTKTKVYELKSLSTSAFYSKTGIRLSGEPSKLPWDAIAHVAGRYPPRTGGSITDNLCLRIMRYEEAGAEHSKLFPLSKAPWPLLLLLTQQDELDESTYWWTMYRQKGSVPGYATYSFDYTKPEIRYNDGNWDPNATPRILTDGGVCGRLSTMAEFAQRSIGTPAQGMGQPGHRAFMTYSFRNGRYSADMHHSVDSIEVSTVGWHLPPFYGPVTDSKTKLTGFAKLTGANSNNFERNNIRWHIGLCEAMNIGLAKWEDSRMALHVLDIYEHPASGKTGTSKAQNEALLRSAMLLNIANTDIVFRLAAIRKGDARRILDLMEGFGNFFVNTAEGCVANEEISRGTDFGNTQAGADLTRLMRSNFGSSVRNTKKIKNQWALFIRNAIFLGAFTNIPDKADPKYGGSAIEWVKDKRAYAKAVADEFKYQKKLKNSPFFAKVKELNEKYDRVRLQGEQKQSVNVKEERARKQADENVW